MSSKKKTSDDKNSASVTSQVSTVSTTSLASFKDIPQTNVVLRYADEKYKNLGAKTLKQTKPSIYLPPDPKAKKYSMKEIRDKLRALLGVSRFTVSVDPNYLFSAVLPAFFYALNNKLGISLEPIFDDKRNPNRTLFDLYEKLVLIDAIFHAKVSDTIPKQERNIEGDKNFELILKSILEKIPHKDYEVSKQAGSHKGYDWKFILPNGTTPDGTVGHFKVTLAEHAGQSKSGYGIKGVRASLAEIGEEYERLWEEKKELYIRIRKDVGDLFVANLLDKYTANPEEYQEVRFRIPSLLRNIKNASIKKRKTLDIVKSIKKKKEVNKLQEEFTTRKIKERMSTTSPKLYNEKNIESIINSIAPIFESTEGGSGQRNFTRKNRKV